MATPALGAVLSCCAAFNTTSINQIHVLRRLGQINGFLDGDKHNRDAAPDVGVSKVVASLTKTTDSRLVLSIWLTYNRNMLPSQMNWAWLPLEIGLYGILLDFCFYWYHRLMHDHPSPLLTAYTGYEQEFFDMVGIPMMTYFSLRLMGLPTGFCEWWICHQSIAFVEVFGHSGLRVHLGAISTMSWLLQILDCDIVIEDHDLHHRKGWRKSHNYGKQTRLWDRIFGTCHERIECAEANIDWNDRLTMPFF
ncbi:unnamed protein product [Penicillium pancosmium]